MQNILGKNLWLDCFHPMSGECVYCCTTGLRSVRTFPIGLRMLEVIYHVVIPRCSRIARSCKAFLPGLTSIQSSAGVLATHWLVNQMALTTCISFYEGLTRCTFMYIMKRSGRDPDHSMTQRNK